MVEAEKFSFCPILVQTPKRLLSNKYLSLSIITNPKTHTKFRIIPETKTKYLLNFYTHPPQIIHYPLSTRKRNGDFYPG